MGIAREPRSRIRSGAGSADCGGAVAVAGADARARRLWLRAVFTADIAQATNAMPTGPRRPLPTSASLPAHETVAARRAAECQQNVAGCGRPPLPSCAVRAVLRCTRRSDTPGDVLNQCLLPATARSMAVALRWRLAMSDRWASCSKRSWIKSTGAAASKASRSIQVTFLRALQSGAHALLALRCENSRGSLTLTYVHFPMHFGLMLSEAYESRILEKGDL